MSPRIMESYIGQSLDNRISLAQIDTPSARGRFHKPISFANYVDEVELQLDKVGLRVIGEEHCITHEANRHFGVLELAPGTALQGDLITSDEWRLFMALRGSHDQSVQRGLALGREVQLCTNLCIFSGDLGEMHTKQTLNVLDRLPGLIYNAVTRAPELAILESHRIERMQEFELAPRHGDMLLAECVRRDILAPAQFGRALKQWDEPEHQEFAENGHTAWRLEQAVTEAVKPANPDNGNPHLIHKRTSGFTTLMHELMDAA